MTTDDELIDAMLVAMYDDGCPGAVDSMRAVLAVVRAHGRDGVVADLKRAFSLGQTYWQQADSEYTSHHRKADVTRQKFDELCAKYSAAKGEG